MRRTRFGILGCARICRRGMIPGIQLSKVATLGAIASRRGEVAQQWAQEFSIPKSYDSYQAILEDPEIDAVYVPLPNEQHLEWTFRAAEAGKHVLCEKPLALNADQAQQMVDKCREHNVLLMEAFMWRHHPRVLHARELVRSGALGDLRLVKMDFSFLIDPTDWRLDPARGGGPLFDLGCYGINAARFFTDAEPVEISAMSHMGPTGVELTTTFQLRFPGDVLGQMDCSFECPDRNRIEIVGSKSSLELIDGVLPTETSPYLLSCPNGAKKLSVEPLHQYAEQVRTFVLSIESGELIYPAENGLANMQVLDQVVAAARATAMKI